MKKLDDTDDEGLRQVDRRDFLQLTAALAAAGIGTQALAATTDGPRSEKLPARTVVVLGATGHVGNAITGALLTAGHRVVAVSPQPGQTANTRVRTCRRQGLRDPCGRCGIR
jgi:predicted RNA-binding Zn-ribbon protein involved in translation (DUF1610 family)